MIEGPMGVLGLEPTDPPTMADEKLELNVTDYEEEG